MAYCTRCGQAVNEGDTFCSGCGAEMGQQPKLIQTT